MSLKIYSLISFEFIHQGTIFLFFIFFVNVSHLNRYVYFKKWELEKLSFSKTVDCYQTLLSRFDLCSISSAPELHFQ